MEDIFAYVDDIMILAESLEQIKTCIEMIETWSEQNNLIINKKKSTILEFTNRRVRRTTLTVGNDILGFPIVEKYKYLGTWLNQKPTIEDQIKHIITKTYFARSRLTPSLYNASMDFWKNLWQVFVLPLYEYALPIYTAENARTRKELVNKQLRASFRSYIGLKKTVKLDLLHKLMGYNLDERGSQLQYISEQKWAHRQLDGIYNIADDVNSLVRKEKSKNICKEMPKELIKCINKQNLQEEW